MNSRLRKTVAAVATSAFIVRGSESVGVHAASGTAEWTHFRVPDEARVLGMVRSREVHQYRGHAPLGLRLTAAENQSWVVGRYKVRYIRGLLAQIWGGRVTCDTTTAPQYGRESVRFSASSLPNRKVPCSPSPSSQ